MDRKEVEIYLARVRELHETIRIECKEGRINSDFVRDLEVEARKARKVYFAKFREYDRLPQKD